MQGQTHAGSLIVSLVSVDPVGPWLVDFLDHFLLFSLTPRSYSYLFPSSTGIHNFHLMFGFGPLSNQLQHEACLEMFILGSCLQV